MSSLEDDKGIYCIKVGEQIVYIGHTCRSFKERWEEHKDGMRISNQWLYKKLRDAARTNLISFEIILPVKKMAEMGVNKRRWTKNQLECAEFALITYLQPIYNTEGVTRPFRFTEKKKYKGNAFGR